MAFIWKEQKSGSWYLDYTLPGGKRVGRSKQAAQLALKEVEYQLSFDRAGITNPDVILKEFFERYEQSAKPKLRSKSWTRYRAIIDHFSAFLGPGWERVRLQQLTRPRSCQTHLPSQSSTHRFKVVPRALSYSSDSTRIRTGFPITWSHSSRDSTSSGLRPS